MANIRVIRPGKPDLVMHPSRRTFRCRRMTTTEAAIHTTGFADIYAVLGEERDGAAVMRLHYNPLAPWIWLGGLVMAVGGGLSLADRRLRVGAPARRRARRRVRHDDRRQVLLAAPLGVAVLGGGAFWSMLRGMEAGTFDPRGVPSPITGQPVPPFDLPAQAPGQGFSSADLASGKPVLLNFFASWCVPCVEEHPALLALAKAGLPIWAIAYKDPEDKAAQFIQRHGDPYQRIARDAPGGSRSISACPACRRASWSTAPAWCAGIGPARSTPT